jgi:hypothetical protein
MPVEVMFVALGGMGTFLLMLHMVHKQRMAKMQLRAGLDGGGRLEQLVTEQGKEIQRMRDRIATLEKLVTDDDRKLADEIERLRRSENRV